MPSGQALNRLQQVIGLLDSTLRLPNNPRAFMVYLLGLVIVFAGAFMHVLVSAQIMQAEFTLSQLQQEYSAIEQQNGDIIFQIARDTNMARLQQRVLDEGYVPVQEREYVFVPSESVPSATIAEATTPAENSAEANALLAANATDVSGSTVASLPATNWGVGQFANWEEFWSRTFRSASDGAPSVAAVTTQEMKQNTTASNAVSGNGVSANTQLSKASPNFWSVWWEQASEQGSKLLEQFSGQ